MGDLFTVLRQEKIIAAIKTEEAFEKFLQTDITTAFLLRSGLADVGQYVDRAHQNGKIIFVHLDFVSGLATDRSAIEFVAREICPDGIISTRNPVIQAAASFDLSAVQRFFEIDSQSVETTVRSVLERKPKMIEIMPGIIPRVISELSQKIDTPIIAGGLIRDTEDAIGALRAGAMAISTASTTLWQEKGKL